MIEMVSIPNIFETIEFWIIVRLRETVLDKVKKLDIKYDILAPFDDLVGFNELEIVGYNELDIVGFIVLVGYNVSDIIELIVLVGKCVWDGWCVGFNVWIGGLVYEQ